MFNFKSHWLISVKFPETKLIELIQCEKNLGWEGGLKRGLEVSKAPFVIFMNDDTFVPHHQKDWMSRLVSRFKDTRVGAVGPSSNVVMGMQNIFNINLATVFNAKFLIGFCMMVKREALDKVGGVDDTLPGGDDIYLSIRLRKAGYTLNVEQRVFVYHHGFKTGERVHRGYWNSNEMQEKTSSVSLRTGKRLGFGTNSNYEDDINL